MSSSGGATNLWEDVPTGIYRWFPSPFQVPYDVSVKSQLVNILGFVDHTNRLCHNHSTTQGKLKKKKAIDNS